MCVKDFLKQIMQVICQQNGRERAWCIFFVSGCFNLISCNTKVDQKYKGG